MKNSCRICRKTKFSNVIDFGDNPLVNSLVEKEDLEKKESVYPLKIIQCGDCFLVQVEKPVSSEKIYTDKDYLYYSGDMPQLSEYFADYAREISKYFSDGLDLIVEIGSNDGILLKHFFGQQRILGVDPSTNVVIRALSDNVPTLSSPFTERVAKSIVREFGKAQVITINNAFAHIDDIHDVMAGIDLLLQDDGVLAIECNYWGGMVKNRNYSLIYHDHYSYFTLQTLQGLLEKYDLKIFDAMVTPAQGGSLRVFAGRVTFGGDEQHTSTSRFQDIMKEEVETNLNSIEIATNYGIQVKKEAEKLYQLINSLRIEGKTIAGYGAAAKGFSVLKLAGLNEKHIDYFVDDSSAKQGKFTPVTHIPIISREEADKRLPDYFFITAPNYADIIMAKEKGKFEGQFITVENGLVA